MNVGWVFGGCRAPSPPVIKHAHYIHETVLMLVSEMKDCLIWTLTYNCGQDSKGQPILKRNQHHEGKGIKFHKQKTKS